MACEPRAHSAWTCIVGCRSKSEIAKPVPQFVQIGRRMAQRLDRIEWIGEAMPASSLRHELRDARGALWADGTGVETAFLPDHTGEKLDRERVLRRCLLECPTNVVRCRLMRRSNLFDLSRRCGTRLCVDVPAS